jgi:uncharacterized protein (TIGR00251 family)
MIEIHEKNGVVSFLVRVQPRASRDEIGGEWQGALRVRLSAPPVDDKANEALRRLLAERLKVPVTAVRIAQGQHSRSKRVEIRGATSAQVLNLILPQDGKEVPGKSKPATREGRGIPRPPERTADSE